jgi:hypothetical protein
MNLLPLFLIAPLPAMVASQSSQSSSEPGSYNFLPTNLPTHTVVIATTSTDTDFVTTTTVTPSASESVSPGTQGPQLLVLTASVTSLSTLLSTSCGPGGTNCDTATSFTTVLDFSLITITTREITAVVITTSAFSQTVEDGMTITSWFNETTVDSSPTFTTET